MKAYGVVEKIQFYAFLIIALDGVESASCSVLFNPSERVCDAHGIAGRMGPRDRTF